MRRLFFLIWSFASWLLEHLHLYQLSYPSKVSWSSRACQIWGNQRAHCWLRPSSWSALVLLHCTSGSLSSLPLHVSGLLSWSYLSLFELCLLEMQSLPPEPSRRSLHPLTHCLFLLLQNLLYHTLLILLHLHQMKVVNYHLASTQGCRLHP